VVHDYDPHRINDFVDTIARPHAERLVAALLPFGHADLLGDYFEPAALLAHAALLGIDSDAARLRRWGIGMVNAGTNFHGDPDRAAEGHAAMADLDTVVDPLVGRLRTEPNESLISQLIHRAAGGQRGDADVVPVVKQFVQGQLQAGWVGGWRWRCCWRIPTSWRRCAPTDGW